LEFTTIDYVYSNKLYSVKSIEFLIPYHLKNSESKKELDRILNQLMNTQKKLNFIIERRAKSVNEYRRLHRIEDELGHDKTFEKQDVKKEKSEIREQFSPVLISLVVDTEIYFLYVRILLDVMADLIYYYQEGLPENTKHHFSRMYYHITENGCTNPFLEREFKEKLKWYPLMVEIPRNLLTAHDKITTGLSWNDHGDDISIGKSGEKYKDPDSLMKLKQIFQNHPNEFPGLDTEYIQPNLRIIVKNCHFLDHEEIEIAKKISEEHAVFPYVSDVQINLQAFLDFIKSRFSFASLPHYW